MAYAQNSSFLRKIGLPHLKGILEVFTVLRKSAIRRLEFILALDSSANVESRLTQVSWYIRINALTCE